MSQDLVTMVEEALEGTEALFMEPRETFDAAILGVVERFNDTFVLYSRSKVLALIEAEIEGDHPYTEALEHFNFNVLGGWVGPGTPAYLDDTERPVPSYHDLFITTADIPRTSIFHLGYGLEVTCTHASGWRLWSHYTEGGHYLESLADSRLLAGEYDGKWLILDVAGHEIVNSRDRVRDENE